jgi:hypothetical protein
MRGVDITALLAHINRRHGSTFALRERYPHGEGAWGTYAVADARGQQGVLKLWTPDPTFVQRQQELAAALEGLHARGYPAPCSLVVGCTPSICYSISELLPGVPGRAMTPSLVPQFLTLNALQRGHAPAGWHEWPERIITTVLEGGDGYCLLEPLRTYSAETATLLARLQEYVACFGKATYETRDLVHFDVNPTNILIQAGTITGVIDWQDPCAGDCTFDVVTVLFYAWDEVSVRQPLWANAIARVGPHTLGVYLAHLILRQVDWAIRHHGDAATAAWIARSWAILATCRAEGAR